MSLNNMSKENLPEGISEASGGGYRVTIPNPMSNRRIRGHEIYLGTYTTIETAIEARKNGEDIYWHKGIGIGRAALANSTYR